MTDVCIDYTTITLSMLILLLVARKTAKALLLSDNMERSGLLVTEQISHLKASKRNNYEETEFQGSIYDSNGDQLALITNKWKADDYEEKKSPKLIESAAQTSLKSI